MSDASRLISSKTLIYGVSDTQSSANDMRAIAPLKIDSNGSGFFTLAPSGGYLNLSDQTLTTVAFHDVDDDVDDIPSSAGSLVVTSVPFLFNGTGLDRQRNNTQETVLASAARTASVNSADFTNHNARGLHVAINVSAYPAAASIVPTIQGKDPVSGDYYDILVGNAITATGYTILKVYPGIGEIANAAAADILPRIWRVVMTHADTDSITYSVGANLVV